MRSAEVAQGGGSEVAAMPSGGRKKGCSPTCKMFLGKSLGLTNLHNSKVTWLFDASIKGKPTLFTLNQNSLQESFPRGLVFRTEILQ